MDSNWPNRLVNHSEREIKSLSQFFGISSDTQVASINYVDASAGRCDHTGGRASSRREHKKEKEEVELHVSRIPEGETTFDGKVGVVLLGSTSAAHSFTVKFSLTESEAIALARALLNATGHE